jgi:peptide/nickel transport system permease protein
MTLRGRLTSIGRFLAVVAVTYFGLLAVTFFIGRVVPIDPVLAIVGDRAPEHVVQRVRQELGLDLPLYRQFGIYLGKVAQGDFGTSVLTSKPVLQDIARAFPATLELATAGILVGAGLGVPLGVWAAVRRGGWVDQAVRVLGLVGYSVPIFWLGLMALVVFYAKLGWVAGPGRIDVTYEYTLVPLTGLILLDTALAGEWDAFGNALSHLALPAALLGAFSMAYISRMTRSFMLHELAQEYIVAGACQGPVGGPHHLAPRAAQRTGAAGHGGGAVLRRAAGRLGADRDRVRLAGPGPVHHQLAAERRHERGAGRHAGGGHDLHRPEPVQRRAVPPAGPQDAAAMSSQPLHDWLMSERPASRRQAALGRAYAAWRGFARNRLAMGGLAIVLALVGMAVFADWIAPYSPTKATCARCGCCRRRPRTGSAPTTRAAISCRASFMARASRFRGGLVAVLAAVRWACWSAPWRVMRAAGSTRC